MKIGQLQSLPREWAKKFLKELNQARRFVVVRSKSGDGVTIYDVEKYFRKSTLQKKAIQNYKPWLGRQKSVLGAIGSQALGANTDLSRATIYEGR